MSYLRRLAFVRPVLLAWLTLTFFTSPGVHLVRDLPTDAPYLGEAAIAYFLTVPPAEGVPVVQGGGTTGLVWFGLATYGGGTLLGSILVVRSSRRLLRRNGPPR